VSPFRGTAIFALVSLGLIAVVAVALSFAWPSPEARRALVTSGVVAVVVQVVAFVVMRLSAPANAMAGWGVGMLLRLLTLLVYGWLVVRALALPAAPALVGLVSFFFVTSLAEPVILKR
jgi:hypothetical protein